MTSHEIKRRLRGVKSIGPTSAEASARQADYEGHGAWKIARKKVVYIHGTYRNKAKIKNTSCDWSAFEGQRAAFRVAKSAWHVEESKAGPYKRAEKNSQGMGTNHKVICRRVYVRYQRNCLLHQRRHKRCVHSWDCDRRSISAVCICYYRSGTF